MKFVRSRVAAAATALLAAGMMTNAAAGPVVTLWNYSVTTVFAANPDVNVFTAGVGTQIENERQVSWGDPAGNVFSSPSGGRSGITIADSGGGGINDPTVNPNTGQVVTDAVAIPGIGLGAWVTHHNNPISGSFATLLSTRIDSTLTLTAAAPPTPGQQGPTTLNIPIFFAETVNAEPCTVASPAGNPCNDIFALNPSTAFNSSFVFDGNTYFVSTFPLAGAGLGSFLPLSAAACAAAGADPGCVGFTTVEGQDTTVRFGFAITASRLLPEPGTLALGGLALVLAGLARRRKVAA